VPAWRVDDETELPPVLVFTAAASTGSQTFDLLIVLIVLLLGGLPILARQPELGLRP
jgi:hypothetical protein